MRLTALALLLAATSAAGSPGLSQGMKAHVAKCLASIDETFKASVNRTSP